MLFQASLPLVRRSGKQVLSLFIFLSDSSWLPDDNVSIHFVAPLIQPGSIVSPWYLCLARWMGRYLNSWPSHCLFLPNRKQRDVHLCAHVLLWTAGRLAACFALGEDLGEEYMKARAMHMRDPLVKPVLTFGTVRVLFDAADSLHLKTWSSLVRDTHVAVAHGTMDITTE